MGDARVGGCNNETSVRSLEPISRAELSVAYSMRSRRYLRCWFTLDNYYIDLPSCKLHDLLNGCGPILSIFFEIVVMIPTIQKLLSHYRNCSRNLLSFLSSWQFYSIQHTFEVGLLLVITIGGFWKISFSLFYEWMNEWMNECLFLVSEGTLLWMRKNSVE